MEQELTPRLRIVFLSSGGILGDIVLQRLLESGKFDVAGIVRSRRVMLRHAGFLRGAIAYFTRCGVIYTVYIWLITTFAEALGWITGTGSITRRAHQYKIPVLHTRDINSAEGLAFLKRQQPQVLISAHFDQPLRTPLCDGEEFAAVNLHPSTLPANQGLEPVLHTLREGRSNLGVTLHRTAADIDSGNILASGKLEAPSNQSVFGLMCQLMELGGKLIVDQTPNLDKPISGQPQVGVTTYHSWPTGKEVWQLYRQGHRLITFHDSIMFFRHT